MENNIKKDQLNWQIFSVIMPFKYDHPFVYINLNSIIKQNKYIKDFFLIADSAQERVKKIYEKYLMESELFDRFMILDSPYIGPGAARDHGAKKCSGEYIAFIDSDDIWPEDYLRLRLDFLNNKKIKFSASPYLRINEKLKDIELVSPSKSIIKKTDLLFFNPIGNSTVIIERKLFLRLGGYSHIKKRNDLATWIKIINEENCFFIKNIKPVKVVKRNDSLSANKIKLIKYQFCVYRDSGYNFFISLVFTIFTIFLGILKKLKIL